MILIKKVFLGMTLGMSVFGYSQDLGNIRPVLTGAPFLRISPDARSGGMGDQGVATGADSFSQFWNAAKYPFNKNSSAASVSYTPYMNKLTNDMFLLYGSFYTLIDDESRSSISASLYYFNMGSVDLSRIVGTGVVSDGTVKPNEFSLDVAYGLKLSDSYSMAVTGKYIRSDLGSFNSDNTLKPANTFAIDISGYYQTPKHPSFGDFEGRARGGFSIQNLGPKLDYSGNGDSQSYLPTTARLGGGYDLYLDNDSRVGLTLEASKLLVPAPEAIVEGGNISYQIPDVGVVPGIGKSFSNPKSIMFSVAAEYSYQETFAFRTGYFTESAEQGGRKFATLGVGLKYQSFGLDISYLINTSKINSALDNTLRFGLAWNIGQDNHE